METGLMKPRKQLLTAYRKILSRKDFSSIPEEDVDELMQIIRALAKRLAAKTSRRYKSSQHQ